MLKNKKGQIGETMQEIVGTITIAFIILFFFLISPMFGLPSFDVEQVTEEINEKTYDHYFILTKLNEQIMVDYDGKSHELDLIDVIRLSQINENTLSLLDAKGIVLESRPDSFYVPNSLNYKIYVSKKQEENE